MPAGSIPPPSPPSICRALPAPTIVEALSYETIYAAMLATLQALLPDFDATVESEPAVKLLQVAAYREHLLRQRVNEAARAMMTAYALGGNLDNPSKPGARLGRIGDLLDRGR